MSIANKAGAAHRPVNARRWRRGWRRFLHRADRPERSGPCSLCPFAYFVPGEHSLRPSVNTRLGLHERRGPTLCRPPVRAARRRSDRQGSLARPNLSNNFVSLHNLWRLGYSRSLIRGPAHRSRSRIMAPSSSQLRDAANEMASVSIELQSRSELMPSMFSPHFVILVIMR